MTSLPPEVKYPMDPLNKVYLLSKFDVSSFFVTRDFQTGNFTDFEQFKIDSHFAKLEQNWY